MIIRVQSEDSSSTSELQQQAIQLIDQSITATHAKNASPESDDENHAVVKAGKKTIFVDSVDEGNPVTFTHTHAFCVLNSKNNPLFIRLDLALNSSEIRHQLIGKENQERQDPTIH
jgi:hypothetical protein